MGRGARVVMCPRQLISPLHVRIRRRVKENPLSLRLYHWVYAIWDNWSFLYANGPIAFQSEGVGRLVPVKAAIGPCPT